MPVARAGTSPSPTSSARSGGMTRPSPAPSESAIEKHAACAAAISSSGLVLPPGSSERAAQLRRSGAERAARHRVDPPLPLIRSPCQVTSALRSVAISSSSSASTVTFALAWISAENVHPLSASVDGFCEGGLVDSRDTRARDVHLRRDDHVRALPSTSSSVTTCAVTSSCSGGDRRAQSSPARAIAWQPACAAASSSSGLVLPSLPSRSASAASTAGSRTRPSRR